MRALFALGLVACHTPATFDGGEVVTLETSLWQMHQDGVLKTAEGRARFAGYFLPDALELSAGGIVDARKDILDDTSAGAYVMDHYRLGRFTVIALSPTAALVTYVAEMTYTMNGETQTHQYAESAVWLRRDGAWKQQFHQTTRLTEPGQR